MACSWLQKEFTLPAFSLLLLILIWSNPISAQTFTGNLFYFHDNSILYRNDNSSVVVIAEANLDPPNSSISKFIDVAANIRNATTPFGTVWVGSVTWISQPISQSEMLQGFVTVTTWLSSDASPPGLSGIGGGIVVVDNQNNIVGQPAYSYVYGQGSVLTSQVKSYQFRVYINQNVQPGQRLIFVVGLGATTQGWDMRVYFDSLDYPTRAQLPGSLVVLVSEPPLPLTATLALLVALTLLSRITKWRQIPRT